MDASALDVAVENARGEYQNDGDLKELPDLIRGIALGLDAIETILENLEARLDPVLEGGAHDRATAAELPREARKTRYGSQLDSITYRLDRIGNQLISLTTRLEV